MTFICANYSDGSRRRGVEVHSYIEREEWKTQKETIAKLKGKARDEFGFRALAESRRLPC